MPDFATALQNAQIISDVKAESRARASKRREAYNAPRGLVASTSTIAALDEERTAPCFDPWMILRAEPNREHAAWQALRREGFEAWYPAGRRMRQLPQRFLPSKTRHKKRHVVIEDLRLPYPGYIFIRRMTQHSQAAILWRLYELDGIVGVCMFGDRVAIAEDYEIQMLRFKEDMGAFDIWDLDITAKAFQLSEIRRTEPAKERWSSAPKLLGTIDSNRGPSLYLVEAFGRITRVIASHGDLNIQR